MESCAIGHVKRVFGAQAEVEVNREEACASCSSADLCHGLSGRGKLLLEVDNRLGARVGQRVRIGAARSLGLQAAFFVYLVPALFFVAGVIVGTEALHWPAWGSGLLGLGTLGISWLIARAFERSARKRPEYQLVIDEILREVVPEREGDA